MPSRTRSVRPARPLLLAALGSLVLSVAVSLGSPQLTPPAHAAPFSVSGIDVSGWQHPGYSGYDRPGWVCDCDSIDWGRVAGAGHQFAIIKATEATDYVNPYFDSDTRQARANGLVVGAYHYARPALPMSTANQQARHYVRITGKQRAFRTLPPVLDIETTGGLTPDQVAVWSQRWLDEVQALTGRTPMIYSYDSFLKTSLGRIEHFAGYPLWLARYRTTPPPDLPGAWSKWDLWQHTSKGAVPGITGNVDLNWFNGSRADLLRLAGGKVPATLSQVRVQKGERTVIAGAIDATFAGARVEQRKRTRSGRWVTKRTKAVRADGSYRFTARPTTDTAHRYRVYLRSATPFARTRSKTLTVRLDEPRITAAASVTRVKRGGKVVVSGRTDTFYAKRPVQLRKLTPRGWVTTRAKKIGRDGTYRFVVRPKDRGRFQFQVFLRAKKPFRAYDGSKRLTVKVR